MLEIDPVMAAKQKMLKNIEKYPVEKGLDLAKQLKEASPVQEA